MLKKPDYLLFAGLRPAFGEFMKRLKNGAPLADAAAE